MLSARMEIAMCQKIQPPPMAEKIKQSPLHGSEKAPINAKRFIYGLF